MLPRYTKQYDDRDPLLPTAGHRQGRESIETAPPTYPPAGPSTADGRHNVEYSYTPVYPRKGKAEHVVGVLGNTKQETIQIVQRGIEGLSTIDPERMTFKILLGTGDSQHWAKVLDEAWERFDADPPKRLAIVVADEPGDDHLRMSPLSEGADGTRREWLHGFYALMALMACVLFGVGLYKLLERLESAKKAE